MLRTFVSGILPDIHCALDAIWPDDSCNPCVGEAACGSAESATSDGGTAGDVAEGVAGSASGCPVVPVSASWGGSTLNFHESVSAPTLMITLWSPFARGPAGLSTTAESVMVASDVTSAQSSVTATSAGLILALKSTRMVGSGSRTVSAGPGERLEIWVQSRGGPVAGPNQAPLRVRKL